MSMTFLERLASFFAMWFPRFRAGQLVIYQPLCTDMPPRPAVIECACFTRSLHERKLRWAYDLAVFRFDEEAVVRMSTYVSTVPESQLRPVGR